MALSDSVDLVKSSLEAAAIAVGGLWAAWTFHKLQSVRAAQAAIDQNVAASRESERRLLREQPNLDIIFSEISEFYPPSGGSGSLLITVEVRNSGVRNLQVIFEKAGLSVGRIQRYDSPGKAVADVHRARPQWLPPVGSRLEIMPSRIFRAGQGRRIVLVLPIATPGVYLVQFQAPYASLPFEGEMVDAEDESLWINAVEQRLVTVHPPDTG